MFVGRKEYLDDLSALWRKSTSSLVACRGRRRIGKSTLIAQFAERTAEAFLSFEGLPPRKGMTNRRQLDNFATSLSRQTNQPRLVLENWQDAFFWLNEAIDNGKRTVVLLDEISWMGAYDPDFPGYLKSAWDKLLHRHDKLVVVVCGSVSAWIKRNILDNTGFAGRFSRDYILPELPLSACPAFWGPGAERVSSRELFDMLSVTGGIPRYLEEVDPALSADENIRRLLRRRASSSRNLTTCFPTCSEMRPRRRNQFSKLWATGPRAARNSPNALVSQIRGDSPTISVRWPKAVSSRRNRD